MYCLSFMHSLFLIPNPPFQGLSQTKPLLKSVLCLLLLVTVPSFSGAPRYSLSTVVSPIIRGFSYNSQWQSKILNFPSQQHSVVPDIQPSTLSWLTDPGSPEADGPLCQKANNSLKLRSRHASHFISSCRPFCHLTSPPEEGGV